MLSVSSWCTAYRYNVWALYLNTFSARLHKIFIKTFRRSSKEFLDPSAPLLPKRHDISRQFSLEFPWDISVGDKDKQTGLGAQ